MHLNFDYSKALNFFNEQEVKNMEDYVKVAHNQLHNKTGIGNDFLGWLELPTNYDKEEFARIKEASKKIQNNSDVLVVSTSISLNLNITRLECKFLKFR